MPAGWAAGAFGTATPLRDQAELDPALRQAALSAGFENVEFSVRAIAAALDYEQRIDRSRWRWWWTWQRHLGLHRGAPGPRAHSPGHPQQRCNTGRPACTSAARTLDRRLSLDPLMPVLGFPTSARQGARCPAACFDLSTWHPHPVAAYFTARTARRHCEPFAPTLLTPRCTPGPMRVPNEQLGHRLTTR